MNIYPVHLCICIDHPLLHLCQHWSARPACIAFQFCSIQLLNFRNLVYQDSDQLGSFLHVVTLWSSSFQVRCSCNDAAAAHFLRSGSLAQQIWQSCDSCLPNLSLLAFHHLPQIPLPSSHWHNRAWLCPIPTQWHLLVQLLRLLCCCTCDMHLHVSKSHQSEASIHQILMF